MVPIIGFKHQHNALFKKKKSQNKYANAPIYAPYTPLLGAKGELSIMLDSRFTYTGV